MQFLFITIPAAVIPSLMILWFFHSRDRFPEPSRVVWTTFGLGCLIPLPIFLMAMPLLSMVAHFSNSYSFGAGMAFFCAAGPEETLKFAVLLFYCARHSEFDEPMDGLVYGAAASLGFASLENVLYVSKGGLGVALARAFTAVPLHGALGAIMGYYVAQAKFFPHRRIRLLLCAWLVPFILHGLYDTPLITLMHKIKIAKETAEHNPLEYLLLITGSLVVLIISVVWAMVLAFRIQGLQNHGAINNRRPTLTK